MKANEAFKPAPKSKVYQKILSVMSDVKYMAKDGQMKGKSQKTGKEYGYSYLSAEKIIENVRVEMIKQKLHKK